MIDGNIWLWVIVGWIVVSAVLNIIAGAMRIERTGNYGAGSVAVGFIAFILLLLAWYA